MLVDRGAEPAPPRLTGGPGHHLHPGRLHRTGCLEGGSWEGASAVWARRVPPLRLRPPTGTRPLQAQREAEHWAESGDYLGPRLRPEGATVTHRPQSQMARPCSHCSLRGGARDTTPSTPPRGADAAGRGPHFEKHQCFWPRGLAETPRPRTGPSLSPRAPHAEGRGQALRAQRPQPSVTPLGREAQRGLPKGHVALQPCPRGADGAPDLCASGLETPPN